MLNFETSQYNKVLNFAFSFYAFIASSTTQPSTERVAI